MLFLVACRHADAPVIPGPPIAAEPDIVVGTMDQECDGMVAALATYKDCPNLEDGERSWLLRNIEFAEATFAAGKKGNPDEPAQHAIALSCHKAATSIAYANQRCKVGRRPRVY